MKPNIRKTYIVLFKSLTLQFNKKNTYILVFFLMMSTVQSLHAQDNSKENIEFLSQDSYDNLSKAYEDSKDNDVIAKSFTEAFFVKAKREKNFDKKIEGYYLIAYKFSKIRDYDKAILYLDSITTLAKDKSNLKQPAQAHILRANIYGAQSDFTKAMDELAKANTYANYNNNIDQQYEIKYFIALLKNNIGEYQESLTIFKENIAYYKTRASKSESYLKKYIQTLYATGAQYNIVGKSDSALATTKKAINLSLKTKDSVLYGRLVFSAAVSHKTKKEYQSALDSIKVYKKIYTKKKKDIGTLIRIDMHLGIIYFKQGKKDIGVAYLEKADSLSYSENYFYPGIRENYELLIKYYKEKNNTKKQLQYIDKLLHVDKILDKDATYLSKKINDSYTTPNLLLEKQRIIDSLEDGNKTRNRMLIILSVVSIGLIFLLFWNYRKQKKYKKRFHELLEKTTSTKTVSIENRAIRINSELIKDIDISQEIINTILQKLATFEEKKGFLQINLSVGSLAKEFDTNSKYFSKIINTYKNKSFTNYINELRTNYVVNELKTNTKFRKYTIKAIANEIGFNTTEAFSKSFYKTTGIYPSYYIKQLEKKYATL